MSHEPPAFRSRSRSLARTGFTLIELLAVILIIVILVAALTPAINDSIEAAKVHACQQNLRALNTGFKLHELKYGRAPRESGVKLFAALIATGAMENTRANAPRLTCPAIDQGALALGALDPLEWWSDLERVDGTYSAYAGRDVEHFPLRHGISSASGREPLVCDDNVGGLNHRTTTNVLYADGSVQTFELELLKAEGTLAKDATTLVVGPDSPVEDLTKFTLD